MSKLCFFKKYLSADFFCNKSLIFLIHKVINLLYEKYLINNLFDFKFAIFLSYFSCPLKLFFQLNNPVYFIILSNL